MVELNPKLLRHLLPLPAAAFRFYYPAAALILGALALTAMFVRRERNVELVAALFLAEVLMALTSPHYPWYYAWLVPFLCLVPSAAVFYLTCAGMLAYRAGWPPDFTGGSLLYGPFLILLVRDGAKYLFSRANASGTGSPALSLSPANEPASPD